MTSTGLILKGKEGTDKIILSDHGEYVVMHFPSPVDYCALDAETARVVSEQMARKAYKCVYGDTPTTTDKSQITEQIRVRLKNRVRTMLIGWSDAPPAHDVQARHIVDEIMKQLV